MSLKPNAAVALLLATSNENTIEPLTNMATELSRLPTAHQLNATLRCLLPRTCALHSAKRQLTCTNHRLATTTRNRNMNKEEEH